MLRPFVTGHGKYTILPGLLSKCYAYVHLSSATFRTLLSFAKFQEQRGGCVPSFRSGVDPERVALVIYVGHSGATVLLFFQFNPFGAVIYDARFVVWFNNARGLNGVDAARRDILFRIARVFVIIEREFNIYSENYFSLCMSLYFLFLFGARGVWLFSILLRVNWNELEKAWQILDLDWFYWTTFALLLPRRSQCKKLS